MITSSNNEAPKISIKISKKKLCHKNEAVREIEPGILPLWTQDPNHYTIEVLVMNDLYTSMV